MASEYLGKAGVTWLINKLKTALDTKVDKVSGAEANTINTVAVNGTALTPDSTKKVNIEVPTETGIRGIVTGYDYQTSAQVQKAIDAAMSGSVGIDYQVVSTLPDSGKRGIIYLVENTHGTQDVYDEYIWISASSTYEKIGSTDADLSAYVRKVDIVDISETDLAAMWG